jgi:hypothetical protein
MGTQPDEFAKQPMRRRGARITNRHKIIDIRGKRRWHRDYVFDRRLECQPG